MHPSKNCWLKNPRLIRLPTMSTNETPKTVDVTSARPCSRCKGTGRVHSEWAKANGYEGPEGKPCSPCDGKGQFEGLKVQDIIDVVFTTRGGQKSFRKAFPSKLNRYQDLTAGRAYYVWRLARFHGGADVTMPMTADMVTRGDPFKKELDLIAEFVAKKVFGTDMAAAYRWGQVFGLVSEVPAGLPASAQANGPVADDNKPVWEQLELR